MSKNQGMATLVAAALLLLSVLLQSWWAQSRTGASARIGLTRVSISMLGQDVSASLDSGVGASEDAWTTVGVLTWWIGLLGGVALALLALEGLLGFAFALPLGRTAAILCGLGLAGAILFFLVLKPKGLDGGTSWGFFAFVLGGIVGLVPKG